MCIAPHTDSEDEIRKAFKEMVTLKEKYSTVLEYLAVVLSAQCTDKRVNKNTPALFSAYPNAEAMSRATEAEIFQYIKEISYPNSKAAHLLGLAQTDVDVFPITIAHPDTTSGVVFQTLL